MRAIKRYMMQPIMVHFYENLTILYISNNCSQNKSSCNFPYYYCETRARALTGGVNNFKVNNELEVYKIYII